MRSHFSINILLLAVLATPGWFAGCQGVMSAGLVSPQAPAAVARSPKKSSLGLTSPVGRLTSSSGESCTGTLIRPDVVVTTNCFYPKTEMPTGKSIGFTIDSGYYAVDAGASIDEDANGGSSGVRLLHLAHPVAGVDPAQLPDPSQTTDYGTCTSVGTARGYNKQVPLPFATLGTDGYINSGANVPASEAGAPAFCSSSGSYTLTGLSVPAELNQAMGDFVPVAPYVNEINQQISSWGAQSSSSQ